MGAHKSITRETSRVVTDAGSATVAERELREGLLLTCPICKLSSVFSFELDDNFIIGRFVEHMAEDIIELDARSLLGEDVVDGAVMEWIRDTRIELIQMRGRRAAMLS